MLDLERDRSAVGRPRGPGALDARAIRTASRRRRELSRVRAVGVGDPDLRTALAVPLEGQLATVGRPAERRGRVAAAGQPGQDLVATGPIGPDQEDRVLAFDR